MLNADMNITSLASAFSLQIILNEIYNLFPCYIVSSKHFLKSLKALGKLGQQLKSMLGDHLALFHNATCCLQTNFHVFR